MTMTPRQRAVATLEGRPADRVPCLPLIDTSYAAAVAGIAVDECFTNPEAYARALVATLERHPDIDGVSINIGLCDEVFLDHQVSRSGVHTIKTVGGMTWMVPPNDIGSVEHCEIIDFADPRIATDEYLMRYCLRTLQAIPAPVREKYLINTTVTGPYSQVAFLFGVTNLMMGSLDDPEGLDRAVESRVPFALNWVDQLAALDPGCIWIGEGFASNSLVSRDTYRRFVMPYEKRVVDRIHAIGKTSILHICGKLDESLESLLETGSDGVEVDWQVDIPAAKKRIGQSMTLKGNFNTGDLIKFTPDEVYQRTRQLIVEGKPGHRFAVSSGCCLGRDTPPENVDAMTRACLDFGSY